MHVQVMSLLQWVHIRRGKRQSATWEAVLQEQYHAFGASRHLSEQSLILGTDLWEEVWDTVSQHFGHVKWARHANAWDGLSTKASQESQGSQGSQGKSEGRSHQSPRKEGVAEPKPKTKPKGLSKACAEPKSKKLPAPPGVKATKLAHPPRAKDSKASVGKEASQGSQGSQGLQGKREVAGRRPPKDSIGKEVSQGSQGSQRSQGKREVSESRGSGPPKGSIGKEVSQGSQGSQGKKAAQKKNQSDMGGKSLRGKRSPAPQPRRKSPQQKPREPSLASSSSESAPWAHRRRRRTRSPCTRSPCTRSASRESQASQGPRKKVHLVSKASQDSQGSQAVPSESPVRISRKDLRSGAAPSWQQGQGERWAEGDWACAQCNGHNFKWRGFCLGCGLPRNANFKPGDWFCKNCGNCNFKSRQFCNNPWCRFPRRGNEQ